MLKPPIITTLTLCNNSNVINDQLFKSLLENTISVLKGDTHKTEVSSLYTSKPDVIKAVFAALLTAFAEFVRNNLTGEQVQQYLIDECKFTQNRSKIFTDLYKSNKVYGEITLGNIGNHVEHIVDIRWKIDYITMGSNITETEGPIFRVTLVTEKFNEEAGKMTQSDVNFSCNCQELQDLVYKLKDATRHCLKFAQKTD